MTDFNVFAWIRGVRATDLPIGVKAVLYTLASHANGEGTCFPSHELLAEECSCSPSTLSRHLKEARGAGWLKSERRVGLPSLHTLIIPKEEPGPRKLRTSQNEVFADCSDRKTEGANLSNRDVRTLQNERSYIRKNYPERTTQQNNPAAAEAAGEVQGDRSSPSLPAPAPIPTPVQGQVEVVQVKEVKAQQEERHSPAELRERWRRALVAANLSFVALPDGLLQQLLEATEERVEEALGSLHSGVRYPVTWARKILNGEAERPQRASPRHSDGGGDDIWTGGRNPRVKVTAINQPDDPYRFSGKPSIYVPPGLSLEGHGGEA